MPVTSPLVEEDRKVTGDALQGAVGDLVDLALVAKQAHWNLIGPRFRSLHLQLDESRRGTDMTVQLNVLPSPDLDGHVPDKQISRWLNEGGAVLARD